MEGNLMVPFFYHSLLILNVKFEIQNPRSGYLSISDGDYFTITDTEGLIF